MLDLLKLAVFSLLLSSITAVSSNFTLALSTSKSEIKSFAVVSDGYDLFVANTTAYSSYEALYGVIQGDGSLRLDNGTYIGISKNYLTITSNTTDYASPFSVKSGYLYLYGSKEFKAIPSGQDGQWVIGSNGATSTADSVYTISIKALDSSGSEVGDFSISSSGAVKSMFYSYLSLVPLVWVVYSYFW